MGIETKRDKVKQSFDVHAKYVCNYFEVDSSVFLHSNRKQCVDARYIVVYKLCEAYHDDEIANTIGISIKVVNKIRNKFSERLSDKVFKNDYDYIVSSLL